MKKLTKKKNVNKKKNIIIATGGSGGHIFPARAFASYAKSKGYNPIILADANYLKYIKKNDPIEFRIIQAGKKLKNPKDIKGIIFGMIQSFWHLLRLKPVAVIGFGGYGSIPTLFSSTILCKKIILHEQNSYIGRVNKIFLRFAKKIATSYREFYGIKFEYMKKVRFVGMPLRPEIKRLANSKYKSPNFNKKEKFNILVLGGSGGSKFFSEGLVDAIANLESGTKQKINMIQQCRAEHVKGVKEKYQAAKIQNEVRGFFKDIDKKIEKASLIIARSGASSLSEFSAIGRPVICIPFPFAINDHQMKNAKALEARDGVVVINQKEFDEKEFKRVLTKLINNPERLKTLALNLHKCSVLNSEERLFDVFEEVVNVEN